MTMVEHGQERVAGGERLHPVNVALGPVLGRTELKTSPGDAAVHHGHADVQDATLVGDPWLADDCAWLVGRRTDGRERLARHVGDLRIRKIRIGAEQFQCFSELGAAVEGDEGTGNERTPAWRSR